MSPAGNLGAARNLTVGLRVDLTAALDALRAKAEAMAAVKPPDVPQVILKTAVGAMGASTQAWRQ